MQIAVIGGDARQLEVIRRLSELDARVYLVGFDLLSVSIPGTVKENMQDLEAGEMDALILPVSGTLANGKIETVFTNKDVVITEAFMKKTKPEAVVYTGISNDYLNQLVIGAGHQLVNLMDRDDVAIYNSIPTAEGVLLLAIQNTDFTIHGSRIAIIGLGRCGLSLARVFAALGAHVKVGARKSSQLARVSEMGLTPFHLEDLEKEIEDVDICINTVPALVLTTKVIAKMPLHTTIIDIASKPGGTDFRYADKRGIKAILAPGLPGIVAPKTAGKILANVLSQLLMEQFLNSRKDV